MNAVIEYFRTRCSPSDLLREASPAAIARTERELQEQKRRFARQFGCLYYHTHTAVHSPAGFPDDITVAGRTIIVAENKGARGALQPEQQKWLDALASAERLVVFPEPVRPDSYPAWAVWVLLGLTGRSDAPPLPLRPRVFAIREEDQ